MQGILDIETCIQHLTYDILNFRVRKAQAENAAVIDVDGTYLEHKRQQLLASQVAVAPLQRPPHPPCGWQTLSDDNRERLALQMPCVLPTTLYAYLAEGVGNAKGAMAFRALRKGYIHWQSGRLSKIEVHTFHPSYVFVKCITIPSMRAGTYTVKVTLKKEMIRDQPIASIVEASCQCAAG